MPGTYKYSMEIESNVKQLLSDMKEAQDRLDTLEGKEYKINLNIDEKKLGNVISNLEKMLDSLGKGTGDFKQLENLSKELSAITSEVKDFSKAFGKLDDSGAKTLLSSIQNIDRSLSELSQNILNVNKNMSNMGGNTSSVVKQVENISNAAADAVKQVDKLADAQSKLDRNTNVLNGLDSNISKYQEIVSLVKEYYELTSKLKQPTLKWQSKPEDYKRIDAYLATAPAVKGSTFTKDEIEKNINSTYHQMAKGINEGKDFAVKAMKSAIQNYWGNITQMPSDNELLSSRKIDRSYKGKSSEEYIIPKKYQELEKSVLQETIAMNQNNAAYEEEQKQIKANNAAIEERLKLIRQSIKQNGVSSEYNGEYKMGLSLKASDKDKKDIFKMTSDLSQEEMLKEICNMLGVEIPQNAEKAKQAIKEVSSATSETNISSGMKDAIQVDGSEVAATQKIADNFEEAKQNTDKATEAAKDYIRVLSQVGELGVDSKVSAMYERNDGQLESVSWRAKRDDQGQILYDKNGDIDYNISSTVISKYEQLEKIITTADNKVRDLEKSLKDVQNLNPNASTKNIEDQIQYQKDYIQLLEQTVKAISQQDEYLLYEQQIIDARAKAEKEYNLNQGTKSDISNAKQLASEEQKRQKNIEQTNRLLNRQQITIDTIEKSYSKIANPDLDKSVSDTSDLTELSKKKSEIQNLINQLNGQSRNSSNEQEFLQLEKLISEYKQLAKDKLKANNPSKQELGGQDLTVLLEQQVAQYNQLITKAEKYGDATSDIVDKLKIQRDLIAQTNSDGVYTAKSGLKADDYYSARDNYKIGKAQFSSYETDIKNTEKLIQAQKELGEATTKARQAAKDSTQSSVDNALKEQVSAWKNILSIKEKITKTKDTDEIANLQQIKKEYQQNYIEADRILKANSSLYDKEIQVAKLEQIRVETNKKIADYNDRQVSGFDKRISGYESKLTSYQATANKFKDGGWTSDAYTQQIDKLNNAIQEYKTLLASMQHDSGLVTDDNIDKLNKYESEIKEVISTVSNMSAAEKGFTKLDGQKTMNWISQQLRDNSKMSREAKNQIKAYYAQIESGNPTMSLAKIRAEVLEIINAEEQAGRAGKSMWDIFKDKSLYGGIAKLAQYYLSFTDIIRHGRQAISTIVELDDALVDLKKTTSMSSSELENFYYDANDVAKQMGVTTEEIINQASAWSRLGYNTKEQATEMAKLSSQFASISPGMDTDTAQEGLVSIMKAWDIDYSDVKSEIMDNINALGNSMAENNQDIVEGMERSAAALAAVGTSYEDAFAMFSGIQEVLQNAEVSGRALRSISMRIRGYDESTEELSSDLENITGELVDLTKTAEHTQGVSIFKDGSTTEFKSLVDYFGEIHDIWDEMSQKQQNDFLQKAFGKTQAQAGAALIQNYSAVTKSLEVMDNAAGSSDKEMDTVKQSITYKLNALKQTWIGTVQDIVKRGDLGTIIDSLTKLSEAIGFVLDKFGLIPTVLSTTGIVAFIKSFS